MTQNQALDVLKSGFNVFLTGEPGSGKTHTINNYINYLRSLCIEPAITASTGIAATHIGGMTIHSWSGIGIKTKLDKYDLDKIASSEYIVRRIKRTQILIIDEISMLSANMLDMVDMVCREVKQSSEPFGGIQIVLVGDFFQLPPIVKKDIFESKQNSLISGSENNNVFSYESGAWKRANLVICYLSEQHRQEDSEFLSLLSGIRSNRISEENLNSIDSRLIEKGDMPENVTKFFSHNFNVDEVNNAELKKLNEQMRSFKMVSSGNEKLVETLKKGCLSPEILELKKGAIVMCTKNNPKEKFANGTLGIVIGFDEFSGYPIIRIKNGILINVSPMEWVVEENGKIRAQISQIPLRLAWSITVHKSQGMSLDTAIMDLSRVFEFGQGYVALSRVRKLSGLYLLGINENALKVHPEVLKKDIFFKDRSEETTKVFNKLPKKDLKKMQDNFAIACGGNVKKTKIRSKEKNVTNKKKTLSEIREKFPNAYRSWSDEQDKELIKLFNSGTKVIEIMRKFGRKRGAINARLEKLGLIKE